MKRLALIMLSIVMIQPVQARSMQTKELMGLMALSSVTTLAGAVIGNTAGQDGAVIGAAVGFSAPYIIFDGLEWWNALRTRTKIALGLVPVAGLAGALAGVACKASDVSTKASATDYAVAGAKVGIFISGLILGGIAVVESANEVIERYKWRKLITACDKALCAIDKGDVSEVKLLFMDVLDISNNMDKTPSLSIKKNNFVIDARNKINCIQDHKTRDCMLQMLSVVEIVCFVTV